MRSPAITLLDNPVLRTRASEIDDPISAEIRKLSSDLHATMLEGNWVGLAAPQIGVPLRTFVMRSRSGPRYPNAPEISPMTVINPEVISRSETLVCGIESCASIPGFLGIIPRPISIQATWLDLEGSRMEMQLDDLAARVFLHELDHLDGILFLDRLESLGDLVAEAEVERLFEKLGTTASIPSGKTCAPKEI